jgi:hypothetical protein
LLQLEAPGHPSPHRVVSTRQVPSQVSVETLHSPSRSSNASRRPWRVGDAIRRNTLWVHFDLCVSIGGVAGMSEFELFGIDRLLGQAHATLGLEPANRHAKVAVDEPEASGHGTSVGEEGRVLDHDRCSLGVTDRHGELCQGGPPQQVRHLLEVRRTHPGDTTQVELALGRLRAANGVRTTPPAPGAIPNLPADEAFGPAREVRVRAGNLPSSAADPLASAPVQALR